MKRLIRDIRRGLLATSLVAGLAVGGAAQQVQESPEAPADEAPQTEGGAVDGESVEDAVEESVQEAADDAASQRRQKIVDEATDALEQTRKALEALENDDADAALESLAIATGKLELVVARSPDLALAPVDTRVVTYDLYATVDDVKRARKQALADLKAGRVQDARRLIEGLRSDLVLEVVNLPLATYPSAIRAVSPLIDAEQIDEAKLRLQRVLNTLVVTRHVEPLPVLRAGQMLARAEELAELEERTEEQSARLDRLIGGARRQLELAQALGYGRERDFADFYEQLDEISEKTSDGKSGEGFFDRIRAALDSFGGSSSDAN